MCLIKTFILLLRLWWCHILGHIMAPPVKIKCARPRYYVYKQILYFNAHPKKSVL